MGAVGGSLRTAAKAHPAGPARGAEAPASGQEEPGSGGTHPAHIYRPLSGAAGHAGKGRTKKNQQQVDIGPSAVVYRCCYDCCIQACQLAVLTTPRDSYALCLLGLAQLAQYDNNPDMEASQDFLNDGCLSFQASIELENQPQSGEPPPNLTSESARLPSSQLISQGKPAVEHPLVLVVLSIRAEVVAGAAAGNRAAASRAAATAVRVQGAC